MLRDKIKKKFQEVLKSKLIKIKWIMIKKFKININWTT